MNFEDWLRMPPPDDVTLGDMKEWFIHSEIVQMIFTGIKRARGWRHVACEVRFVRLPGREELSNDMTLGEFRVLSSANRATMEISFRDGGQKARQPDLVLA